MLFYKLFCKYLLFSILKDFVSLYRIIFKVLFIFIQKLADYTLLIYLTNISEILQKENFHFFLKFLFFLILKNSSRLSFIYFYILANCNVIE